MSGLFSESFTRLSFGNFGSRTFGMSEERSGESSDVLSQSFNLFDSFFPFGGSLTNAFLSGSAAGLMDSGESSSGPDGEAVVSGILDIVDSVTDAVESVGSDPDTPDSISGLAGTLTGLTDVVGDFFGDVQSGGIDAVDTEGLRETAVSLIDQVLDGDQATFGALTETMEGIASDLDGAFEGVFEQASGILDQLTGEDGFGGMLDGMGDEIGAIVTEAVSGLNEDSTASDAAEVATSIISQVLDGDTLPLGEMTETLLGSGGEMLGSFSGVMGEAVDIVENLFGDGLLSDVLGDTDLGDALNDTVSQISSTFEGEGGQALLDQGSSLIGDAIGNFFDSDFLSDVFSYVEEGIENSASTETTVADAVGLSELIELPSFIETQEYIDHVANEAAKLEDALGSVEFAQEIDATSVEELGGVIDQVLEVSVDLVDSGAGLELPDFEFGGEVDAALPDFDFESAKPVFESYGSIETLSAREFSSQQLSGLSDRFNFSVDIPKFDFTPDLSSLSFSFN